MAIKNLINSDNSCKLFDACNACYSFYSMVCRHCGAAEYDVWIKITNA